MTDKGWSVMAKRKIIKGEAICEYKGKLCPFKVYRKNQLMYSKMGKGCYILEFKYKEKKYAIDGTEEDDTFGHLINHSKDYKNVKPCVGDRDGTPFIYFVAICDIQPHELFYTLCR